MIMGDTTEAQNADRRFIRHAMRKPMLSRERERQLAEAWRTAPTRAL